ncbi:MAG: heavy-metal-associated domain-containing protein [Candidatus Methanomethylophilaceae archaeon]|nr:heavy-metal-associated domain-containing protein [Candidatus Methanomethylophilaceae archaeon]MBQ8373152.1 heavy-metal-associated domain-containing protein [Candidatus Methanomethylophilaceae archaeon]
MTKTTLKVEGMMCEGCVGNVRAALQAVPGVTSVDVDLKKGTAKVEHGGCTDEALIGAVVDAGFRASVKRGLFS